jgi:spoIIIJ-associated protein
MNRTIEITAKSEDEARQIAQGELNDNEVILDSEVLTAPARGIFGFVGKQEFKIRFTLGQKAQPVKKAENSIEDRPEKIKRREFSEPDEEPPVRESREFRGYRESREPRESREHRGSRDNRRSAPRQRRQVEEEPIVERPKDPVSDEIRNHEFYGQIFELIREVAANVGVDELNLEDYMRDGAWVIEASGENVSQLIGKRGRTLDSLQYLMNIILNRGNDERIKLVLDAQGYREKRYRNLMSLAFRMYKKALSSRKQVELEPMSTLDRRTVHMALKDKNGIETFSKGSEPMRRVVISPLKKGRNEVNAGWQPILDEADEEPIERNEGSGAVPMFMEEDV